jgi:hypothetical protein
MLKSEPHGCHEKSYGRRHLAAVSPDIKVVLSNLKQKPLNIAIAHNTWIPSDA